MAVIHDACGRFIGTRVAIVVARTIRRLPSSEREEASSVVAMRATPAAGRPADAAAGDAPTVTRHAVERREEIVVPASSGTPLKVGSGECVSAPPNPVSNLLVARAQSSSAAAESSHDPSGEKVVNFGPGNVVPMEVVQSTEPTLKSHDLLEEHGQVLDHQYTVGCPGYDGRSYKHLLKCQQKRIALGFFLCFEQFT